MGGLCHRSSSKLLEGLGASSDKIHDILLDLYICSDSQDITTGVDFKEDNLKGRNGGIGFVVMSEKMLHENRESSKSSRVGFWERPFFGAKGQVDLVGVKVGSLDFWGPQYPPKNWPLPRRAGRQPQCFRVYVVSFREGALQN